MFGNSPGPRTIRRAAPAAVPNAGAGPHLPAGGGSGGIGLVDDEGTFNSSLLS